MKLLLFSFLFVYSFSAIGQADLLEKTQGFYIYKRQIYKTNALSGIYKTHQESLDLYMSGIGKKKTASTLAIVGAPFVILGLLGLSSDRIDNKVLGALSLIAGGVIELIAIAPRIAGNNVLKNAMETFNHEMIRRHGYKEDTSLLLGISGNGFGLIYRF